MDAKKIIAELYAEHEANPRDSKLRLHLKNAIACLNAVDKLHRKNQLAKQAAAQQAREKKRAEHVARKKVQQEAITWWSCPHCSFKGRRSQRAAHLTEHGIRAT